jgi:hypothetical protein
MPLGKKLSHAEIEAIIHTITPIHRVKHISQSTTFLDAEPSTSKMAVKRRNESIDKNRG